jgi:hypothetical protein
MLPNFIVVGASKSGTSSLGQYLKQHPDVFLPDAREPHHFAPAKWAGQPAMNRDDYEALFDDVTSESAVGEISTGYLYYKDSPARIQAILPQCRIVAIVRSPIERAFSGYLHEQRDGMEDVSFETAIAQERDGTRADRGFGFQYVAQGFVHDALSDYIKRFGRSNVHVGLYDDFRTSPGEFMTELFRFLGVDPTFSGQWTHRYNPSGTPLSTGLNRLLLGTGEQPVNKNSLARRLARSLFSQNMRTRIWHMVRDLNIRLGTRQALQPESRLYLESTYRSEIHALENLLGRSLDHWFGKSQ